MKVISTKSQSFNRLKILIYGAAGVGKTTLAASLKEKVLIISAEAGLLSLADRDIDTIDLTLDDNGKQIDKENRTQRLVQVFEYLMTDAAKKKYQWIFLDSLTEISQNVIEALAIIYTDPKDTIKMWGEYSKKMRSLIKTFRDIPYYNIVFTALDAVDKDENNRRHTHPDVQGKVGKNLAGFFDEVFYMYIDADEKRVIRTSPTDLLQAKDRSGKLEILEVANLQLIADKIRAPKQKKKTETNVESKANGVQKAVESHALNEITKAINKGKEVDTSEIDTSKVDPKQATKK